VIDSRVCDEVYMQIRVGNLYFEANLLIDYDLYINHAQLNSDSEFATLRICYTIYNSLAYLLYNLIFFPNIRSSCQLDSFISFGNSISIYTQKTIACKIFD
jgi:hypothetical protein